MAVLLRIACYASFQLNSFIVVLRYRRFQMKTIRVFQIRKQRTHVQGNIIFRIAGDSIFRIIDQQNWATTNPFPRNGYRRSSALIANEYYMKYNKRRTRNFPISEKYLQKKKSLATVRLVTCEISVMNVSSIGKQLISMNPLV